MFATEDDLWNYEGLDAIETLRKFPNFKNEAYILYLVSI